MRSLEIAAILSIAVTFVMTVGAQSSSEKEALEAQARRFRAVIAQDVAALEPMVADEVIYCHGSGQCDGKSTYLDIIRTGRIRWATMAPEDMKTHIYGDTAVITGVVRQTVMSGGSTQPLHTVIRSIEVYVRRNGRWQLTNFQGTVMPQLKPKAH
jgi:hypothetical protein